jgi:hypothetical protein
MASSGPDPAWERRHPSASAELFWFDWWLAGGTLGGFVTLALAARQPAWFSATLVGDGRSYLLVREDQVPAPRAPSSLEIRSEGLWADLVCEEPHDHWSVGLEAFGLAFDDPEEAVRSERGDRTGLGLDLGWEADSGVEGVEGDYWQAGAVVGEVLVGIGSRVERLVVDGVGRRGHRWGGDRLELPVAWAAPVPSTLGHAAPLRFGDAILRAGLAEIGWHYRLGVVNLRDRPRG